MLMVVSIIIIIIVSGEGNHRMYMLLCVCLMVCAWMSTCLIISKTTPIRTKPFKSAEISVVDAI